MNASARWSLLLGGAFSGIALYLAFRHVPLAALWRYLGAVDYRFLGLSLALVGLLLAAKALRWQIIIGAIYRVGFAHAFHPMMIGFMLNCILPGRVGELARPALLRRLCRVPFATGLGTVVTERILDMLTLLALFAWVLSGLNLDRGKPVPFGAYQLEGSAILAAARTTLALALLAIAAVVIWSLGPVRAWSVKLIRGLVARAPFVSPPQRQWIETRLVMPLSTGLEHLAAGLGLVRQPLRLTACIGLSGLIWMLTVVSFQVMALGFPDIELHFSQMAGVLVVICFCIALPSVPGWWGLWEAGGVFALSLFGIEAGPALGFTLVNHAAQVLPVILIGLASMMISGVRTGQLGALSRRPPTPSH